jgi:parallel beta-helix repeat protein
VTADVTLTKSLKGCATGLIVGADNVTIDLNGHAIRGLGTAGGTGIEAVDRTGVTVKNGKITDFAEGVRFFNTSNSTIEQLVVRRTLTGIRVSRIDNGTDSNRILENTVRESGDGIAVFGAASSRIAGNTLNGLTGNGILCRDTFSSEVEIEGNRALGNDGAGIALQFCAASVIGNVASDNVGTGIVRTRSNGSTLRNVANRNTFGIVTDDSHGLIQENVTNANFRNGLSIVDQDPSHGPLHTVTGNTANRNGALGIATDLVGVIDGGGNRAKNNGDSLQCKGVGCN